MGPFSSLLIAAAEEIGDVPQGDLKVLLRRAALIIRELGDEVETFHELPSRRRMVLEAE